MTLDDIGRLIGFIAVGDNRTVDATTILYWEQVLPEWLTYFSAKAAVIEHRRTSTEYLQPAHILAIAEREGADDNERDRRAAEDVRAQLVSDGSPFVSLAAANLEPDLRAYLEQLYAKHQAKRSKRSRPTKIGETDPEEGPADAEPVV